MLNWLFFKKNIIPESKTSIKERSKANIIPRSVHGISRKDIDERALKVLYRLHKAGYQAHLVGGAVRDLLLGKHPKDFDVVTNATPEQVKSLFRNCRLIGRRFRLAHIYFGHYVIEVATFRASHDETSQQDESGRVLRDNVYGTISEDAWRRDFTVNALYYNIADYSVIDYVGGYDDLKKGELRLIGDPDERYREDPVRMLRVLRFASKLGFSINESCKHYIEVEGSLLRGIPGARLYDETLKIFHSGHANECFQMLRAYRLFEYLFPEVDIALKNDETALRFVSLAMQSTDERVRQELPVTPAFLFAALLWAPLKKLTEKRMNDGESFSYASQKAMARVIAEQVQLISIPRRFSIVMRDIWTLQARLKSHTGKRAAAAFAHPKFRAAYDFLCLRSKAGENVSDDCQFWTQFQQAPVEKQNQFIKKGKGKNKRRPRRKRPSSRD